MIPPSVPVTSASVEAPLPRNLVWVHACNTMAIADSVPSRIQAVRCGSASVPQLVPLAIEIDVRWDSLASRVVAAHDVVDVPSAPSLVNVLDALHKALLKVPPSHLRVEVVKFDVKSPAAMEELYTLWKGERSPRKLFPGLPLHRWWFNADVVCGPKVVAPLLSAAPVGHSERDTFVSMPREELREWLVRFGHQEKLGLSLGWVTLPNDATPYSKAEALAMLDLLEDLGGGPAPLVTFPVRYSLVFGSNSKHEDGKGVDEAVDAAPTTGSSSVAAGTSPVDDDDDETEACASDIMLRLIIAVYARGFAQNVFLTFWRGRNESLSTNDVEVAHKDFPNCTVDVD